jgi:hypothetical protein
MITIYLKWLRDWACMISSTMGRQVFVKKGYVWEIMDHIIPIAERELITHSTMNLILARLETMHHFFLNHRWNTK